MSLLPRHFFFSLCALATIAACKAAPQADVQQKPDPVVSNATESAMEIRIEPIETSWNEEGSRWTLRLQVSFTNQMDGVFALDKVTACDGGAIQNNVFEVTHEGAKVDYRGMMMKRRDPGPDGFFRLSPGETHTEIVDLGEHYALPDGGTVSVRFDHFNHFSDNAVQLTSTPVEIELVRN